MKAVPNETKVCTLCNGTGLDTTGISRNGLPEPVCVRCGGYGSIPCECSNPNTTTPQEKKQLEIESKVVMSY